MDSLDPEYAKLFAEARQIFEAFAANILTINSTDLADLCLQWVESSKRFEEQPGLVNLRKRLLCVGLLHLMPKVKGSLVLLERDLWS